MVCQLLLWCWCPTQMCSQTNKRRLVKYTWIWAFGIPRRTVFSASMWCRFLILPLFFDFRLFQSLTHELFQNVSSTGHFSPGTWSLMAAWWFLGVPANIWHSERGRVGWCAWSLSAFAVWCCLLSRSCSLNQSCLEGPVLLQGVFPWLPWAAETVFENRLKSTYSPTGSTPPCQNQLLSCPQVSLPPCLSEFCLTHPWCLTMATWVCCAGCCHGLLKVMDKLGHGLCLTHEIASVALLSHGGDSSRGRKCLWLLLVQPVLSSCLLADSVGAIEWEEKQLKWRKVHKNTSLLPTRRGKYVCEICLEFWVSSLGELLFMSQNQQLFYWSQKTNNGGYKPRMSLSSSDVVCLAQRFVYQLSAPKKSMSTLQTLWLLTVTFPG